MSLTKEQLLIPRVMCVGTEPGTQNYPGSLFKTGDILYLEDSKYFYALDGGTDTCISNPKLSYHDAEKFPHLFRPMQWWEGRDKTDLPKYVKNIKSGRVFKAVWDCFKFKGVKEWSLILQQNGIPINPDRFEPATSQEYLDYQKQKEG